VTREFEYFKIPLTPRDYEMEQAETQKTTTLRLVHRGNKMYKHQYFLVKIIITLRSVFSSKINES